jgi:predicted CopG family antitoxin
MASTQISIRNDIYNRLKREKRENESFSDVIERLLSEHGNGQQVLDCFGIARVNNDTDQEDEEKVLDSYEEAKDIIRKGFNSRFSLI